MHELEALWESIVQALISRYSETTINLWFKDAVLESLNDDIAVISHTSVMKKNIIKTRYMMTLTEVFEEVLGFPVKIVVRLTGEEAEELEKEEADKPLPPPPIFQGNEYTFDNFVVGGSNNFAHAACVAVAKKPSTEYNPLFIYGASGLGKTHLLNAIMNEMQKNNPNIVIIYVKGDEFTNQMIESIATKSTEKFRAKYRKADVLLIDDIQFIAGRDSTQEEFFHTFNALYVDNKQIIMTSDRPPRDIKTLEDRLRTRFEWGLIADIQPPDFELRIAIMRNKAKMLGMEIPDEVLSYVAENLKSNIRQIEGAIKHIRAQSLLNGKPITLELAKKCISAMIVTNDPPEVTAKKIVETVSKKYGIPIDEIYGKSRAKPVSSARNVAIYIIRKITSLSLKDIGNLFDRDHTTIMSSIKSVEKEIETKSLVEIEITEMIREITE
ncbi:MAG: chromosomal replication initiator protein DnaA [Clostridia bacterium]|nr:chromosomal replication initiator protein DnaA [Clostridia bacterium]